MNKITSSIAAAALAAALPVHIAIADEAAVPLPVLTAQWWQWAVSVPNDQNPQTDGTGQYCMVGQRGSVWFLAGTFGAGTATRTCSVPEGRTLFFPVINSVYFNTPGCGQGGQSFTVKELRQAVKPFIDNAQNISVKIDRVRINKNLLTRIQSDPFAAAFPASNIFGSNACSPGEPLPAGIYSPSVDDGYYASIPPLKPGSHTLQFHAESGTFSQDITYTLTIIPVALK